MRTPTHIKYILRIRIEGRRFTVSKVYYDVSVVPEVGDEISFLGIGICEVKKRNSWQEEQAGSFSIFTYLGEPRSNGDVRLTLEQLAAARTNGWTDF